MRARVIGAAGLAAAGVAAARQAARRRQDQAVVRAMTEPGPLVELRGDQMRLPFVFHRSDGFAAVVAADLGRTAAMLPSDSLYPVRLDRGRVAMYIGALRHHEPSGTMANGEQRIARPYGEIFVAALVTPRPAPPLLPLLSMATFGVGAFVLYLPVTSRLALDGGKIWGYPKFVADMDFVEDAGERAVTLSEGGRRLLTLRVRRDGRPVIDRTPTVLYSVRDGQLIEQVMPTIELHRVRLGRSRNAVELGDHAVADTLRALGLGSDALATMTIERVDFAMTAGKALGPARAYRGYAGVERDFGRYTVRHAGALAADQYAGLTSDEWTTVWPAETPVAVESTQAAPTTIGR